ncbi:MAG: hypothetical protein ACO38Y_12670, partial [Steroidobacteraceae bacterium]
GSGSDYVQGGQSNDYLVGGGGNDSMFGGPGDDYLDGGAGDDYIEGEQGRDDMRGGSGSNSIDAADGIADIRVDCGGVPALLDFDKGLDKPTNCGDDPTPIPPAGLTASVGEWQDNGLPVTFTWSPPATGSPDVDTYLLTTPTSATGQTTETLPGTTTSWQTLLPRTVPAGNYSATLTARNTAGESAPAVIAFDVPAQPGPVPAPVGNLAVARDPAATGLSISWSKPAVPENLELQYYQVERRVPIEYRAGSEWRLLGTPLATGFVDRCVPPGLTMEYRVRAYYLEKDTQRVYLSDWRDASGRNPGFPSPAPDPTPAELLFNGITPEDGARGSQRALVKVAFNGQQQGDADCFAIDHEVTYSLQPTTGSLPSAFSTLGVFVGRSQTPGTGLLQRVFPLGPAAFDRYVNIRVQSRWALDALWQRRHGQGFNDNVFALANTVARASASKPVPSPWRIYTSNAGAKVGNLQVAWRDDAGLRITWDAPSDANPNAINGRGYEVCIYTVLNYVYLDDYPTLSHHRCWITARDQRVLTPSLADWCPPWSRVAQFYGCGSNARYMFAQVRPWVGSVRAEPVFPTSVWTDWNRNTFAYARPAS